MALESRVEEFLKLIESKKDYLKHNYVIMDIVDGNLFCYVDKALSTQLSGQPYEIARQRIPPINVLKRIIDKKSKIYNQGVVRKVVGSDSKTDSDILKYYVKVMKFNRAMQTANRYFNQFKNCLIQPYLASPESEGDHFKPALRIIPSDRFIPFSDLKDERERPTGYILIIGPAIVNQKETMVYMAVDKNEYCYFTENKEIVTAHYMPATNPQGKNELKRLPYVYMNRDEKCILPTQDSDTINMTVLIPLLLTDINFAHMFQSFSIIYTLNVKDGNLKFAPNAIWSFQSEPGSDQKPEVGTITPSADINGGLNLVANQFALWLNTLGIKPGEVGEINGSNFSSGIAKMLDEMDTSEDRKDQIPFFSDAEADLWNLILHYMHPAWQNKIEMKGQFSKSASVETVYSEQVPLIRRGAVVAEQATELKEKLTTKKRALQRINPQLGDEQIDELIEEINEENGGDDGGENNGANDGQPKDGIDAR